MKNLKSLINEDNNKQRFFWTTITIYLFQIFNYYFIIPYFIVSYYYNLILKKYQEKNNKLKL